MESDKSIARNVYVILFLQFISSFHTSLWTPFLSLYALELGANYANIGFIFSLASVVTIPVSLLIAYFADLYGRKTILLFGGVLNTFFLGLLSLVNNGFYFPVVYLLYASTSSYSLISLVAISESTSKRFRSTCLSLSQIAFVVGTGTGSLVGGFIKELIGFRLMFASSFVLSFLGNMIVWLFFTEVVNLSYVGKSKLMFLKLAKNFKDTVASYNVLLLLLLITVGNFFFGLTNSYFSIFVNKILGLSYPMMGLMFSLSNFVSIPSLIVGGWLSDNWSRKNTFILSRVLSSVFSLPFYFASSPYIAIVCYLLSGFFGNWTPPTLQAIMIELVPTEIRASAFATFNIVASITEIPGPVIGGYLYTIDPRLPFLSSLSLSTTLSILIILKMRL